MTISTTTSTTTGSGNGVTTVFNFSFVPDSAADIVVTYTDASGVATVLPSSAYTLVINPPAPGELWGVGGSVTYPITGSPPTPIATGTFLTITRAVPYEQNVSINNQGAFYPQVVEQGLDILELQIQQLNTDVDYSIKTPLSDVNPPNDLPPAALRAGGVLGFDANGQPIITTITSGGGSGTGTGSTVRKVSTTGTATINVTTGDAYAGVSIYQSSSPVTTVQLPTTLGPYTVFDGSYNSSTYPIKILPPAGKTILGKTAYALTFDGQSATFSNDGTEILVS